MFFNFCDDEEEEALSALSKFCTDKFRETRKDGDCHRFYFIMSCSVMRMVIKD